MVRYAPTNLSFTSFLDRRVNTQSYVGVDVVPMWKSNDTELIYWIKKSLHLSYKSICL
jgi:hypothetical protein